MRTELGKAAAAAFDGPAALALDNGGGGFVYVADAAVMPETARSGLCGSRATGLKATAESVTAL